MEQNTSQAQFRNDEDEMMQIRRYLSIFLSNWYWFLLMLFIALSLAYGINRYSEPVYSVSSSLLIKDDKDGSNFNNRESIIPGGDMFKSQQTLQNEIGILKSYNLNLRVLKALTDFHITYVAVGRRGIAEKRVFRNCPFILEYDSLQLQTAGSIFLINVLSKEKYIIKINGSSGPGDTLKFGEQFIKTGFNFTIRLRDSIHFENESNSPSRYKVRIESLESLANDYRNNLSIQPINKDATLVTLTTSGFVPLQETEYLNKLMEVYINQGLEYKNLTADSTIKFIDRQLKVISDSLTKAEIKLQNFKDSNRMVNLSSESTAIQTRLERFENEKTLIRLQLQYYKYLEDYINSKNESGAIVSPSLMGISDQVLIKLVADLASLQFQKKQLLYNFSVSIPAIGLIDSRIEDALIALKDNIRNSKETTERTLKDVNERITAVNIELSLLPGTERHLIKFQRNFDINNTVYTYLLEKRSEAGIAKASRISGNRIIDQAVPENSVMISPKSRRNILIAIILGLLVPGAIIFLADVINDKIIDKKDISKGTSVPVLGFIGHSDSKNEIPVFSKPGSALSESFRSIRTNLKYYLKSGKSQVISITSTISGEGKTFVSVNLAAIFAMLGKKTLVVGLDLRKPRMHRIFGSDEETGLSNYLIGEIEFDDLIKETQVSNLFFAHSGPVPPNPAELIESVRMKEFLDRAKEEFDFIILDTPPVGIVSDALLLTPYADVNLFIVRQRYSSKSTLEFIQNIFENRELKNPAIVVNDILIAGYYGYGIRYGVGLYAGYGYDYGYGRYGRYNYGRTGNYYTAD